jgi:hypothetical protein
MISLDIRLDGDGAFEDVRDEAQRGDAFRIAALNGGMTSGNLSIALGVRGDDGKVIVAETSWRLLHAAVRAIEARYGSPA